MIEITAKQLYDMYRHLPNAEKWYEDTNNQTLRLTVQKNPMYKWQKGNFKGGDMLPIPTQEIAFIVDTSSLPFEWKPTEELIIKP